MTQVALTYINFIAPLRMYFWRSKSTLDSLKSDFNAFRRKPLLGAPDNHLRMFILNECNITCPTTKEWPIWWHHMVGHEGCSSLAELSRNKIFKATQYSQIWLYSKQINVLLFCDVTVSLIVLSFETLDKCNCCRRFAVLKDSFDTQYFLTIQVYQSINQSIIFIYTR